MSTGPENIVCFSIIIPTYNYGYLLARALDSCLLQSDNDWEIVVVDDGSTDNTQDVLNAYIKDRNHPIRCILQDNQGPSAARNAGVRYAQGEYLLFLDADDALLPGCLQHFRAFLARHRNIDFLFGGYTVADTEDKPTHHFAKKLSTDKADNFSRFIRKRLGGIATGAALFHRRIFATLKFPEHMRHYEDVVVIAQTLALFRCASFPEPVIKIYHHGDSLRTNLDSVLALPVTTVVDSLFDVTVIPESLMRLRKEFIARLSLSRFRSFYLKNENNAAKQMYQQAIWANPRYLLRMSYLRKYLRLHLKALGINVKRLNSRGASD